MATIKEISKKTGVSIATVSKVLNGKGSITEQTRQLVLSAAAEMNYRPNMNARHLKSGSTQTIGIITEDLTVFNSPEIVDGIAATCEKNGYHYILGNLRFFKRYGNMQKDEVESAALIHGEINNMLSKQVDGIIYIGCHSHIVMPLSSHKDIKLVCAYCRGGDDSIPSVGYNEEKASYAATNLLLDKGCKKIGMITGPSDSSHANRRTKGHQLALYEAGIPYNPAFTCTGNWERDSGYSLAEQLINEGVDAIFSQNDFMALGVTDYCNENGIDVGNDLLLIGFDNQEFASVCRPNLTTISLPLFEIGEASVNLMLSAIAGIDITGQRIELDCTIIERDST